MAWEEGYDVPDWLYESYKQPWKENDMSDISMGEEAYQEMLINSIDRERDMADIQGVIEKMHTKTGQGKRGPWTKYSAVINGGWVNFGFDNPGYSEGDEVKVRTESDQYGEQVKQHKLINKAADVPANSSSGGGSSFNQGQSWGNANNVAASVLASLVGTDALPLTAAGTKANKAKRYDEVLEVFDKLRVQFFQDAQDIERVLSRIADAGDIQDEAPPALPEGDIVEEDSDDDDDF
jgi:hypothetical protein